MLLSASAALAQTFTYDVLFDLDRDAATGCDSTAPGGTLIPGIERRLRASVDATTATVTAVALESCAGTVFGPPVPVGGPHPVGLNNGLGGADVIEAAVSLLMLDPGGVPAVQVVFVAADADGSDVLATTDGQPGGPAIVFGLSTDAIGIPTLSAWGLALLALVLMLVLWRHHRRTGRGVGLVMLVLTASAVLAANFAADGDIGDWSGTAPRATDPAGDATNGGTGNDLLAAFIGLENENLFFRMDVTDLEESQTSAPVAEDDAFATDEDTVLNIAAPGVLANDSDPDADPITAVLDTAPSNAASFVLNPDGSFDYTPAIDFNGTDSFTYVADDGTDQSAPATVTLTVTAVNDPPDAVDDAVTTDEDTPVTFDPLANDSDPDGDPLAIVAVNGVVVVINGDTSATYTPGINFNGVTTFTYTIDDGNGGTDTATVSITVAPVNDPPTAVDDAFTVDQDSINNALDVLANDTDAPDTGETLTITGVGATDQGGTAMTDGLTINYTPAPDFAGVETFTYTIDDGNGGSDTATVTVTVDPPEVTTFAAENLPLSVENTGVWDATIPATNVGTLVKVEVTFQFSSVPQFDSTGQLSVSLHAPDGDSIELFPSGVCGSAAAIGPYTFKDDPTPDQSWPPTSSNPCPTVDVPIAAGEYKPYDPAATFAGSFDGDGLGTWLLRFTVSGAGSPGTTVDQADITLTHHP